MLIQINKILITTGIIILFSACAATHAPQGWLPKNATKLQTETYGGWIVIQSSSNNQHEKTDMGELIAVSVDSVYVLEIHSLVAVPSANITKARIAEYNAHYNLMGGWVFLGTLSTISHGYYSALTAPIFWLFTGSLETSRRSYEPIIDYPKQPLRTFRAYARFPQGLPKHLNRKLLKPKPIK